MNINTSSPPSSIILLLYILAHTIIFHTLQLVVYDLLSYITFHPYKTMTDANTPLASSPTAYKSTNTKPE